MEENRDVASLFIATNKWLDGTLKVTQPPVVVCPLTVDRKRLGVTRHIFNNYKEATYGRIHYYSSNLRSPYNYYSKTPMTRRFEDVTLPGPSCLSWSVYQQDDCFHKQNIQQAYQTYLNRYEYPNDDYILIK